MGRESRPVVAGAGDASRVVPEHLVQLYRTKALERVARIELAWSSLLRTMDASAATEIDRELHTLEAESRMLGFADIDLLCHRLEELVAAARTRSVDPELDLVVQMALRFIALLALRPAGAELAGVDLRGFVQQIDAILVAPRPRARASEMVPVIRVPRAPAQMPAHLRARLAPLAVDAFLEYAAARGRRRDRLRAAWHEFRDMLAFAPATVGRATLAKHEVGALALAAELGKEVLVLVDLAPAEVTAEAFAALDRALHRVVRDAVTAIEVPAARIASGKPPRARLRMRGEIRGRRYRLVVDDDGGAEPRAADAGGLDDAGGTIAVDPHPGGTTWTIEVPVTCAVVEGHALHPPQMPCPVIVDGGWQLVAADRTAPVIDLGVRLGFSDEPSDEAPHYFRCGDRVVGVALGHTPREARATRLLEVPAGAAEVVALDGVEALLVDLSRV